MIAIEVRPIGGVSLRCLILIHVLKPKPNVQKSGVKHVFPTTVPDLTSDRKMAINPSSGGVDNPSNSPYVP